MKSLCHGLLSLSLLALLVSCGKENKSGQSGFSPFGSYSSPYSFNGGSVNQIIAANPCKNGWMGMPGMTQPYVNQRSTIQVPLNNFTTPIAPNDIYIGVTSYGDVAVISGAGPGQPPLFTGYICPRSFALSGQGQLMNIRVGAYTTCAFKPIVAATLVFPSPAGMPPATAEFRDPKFGSSMGGPIPTCQPF